MNEKILSRSVGVGKYIKHRQKSVDGVKASDLNKLNSKTPKFFCFEYPLHVIKRQILLETNSNNLEKCNASCCRLSAHKDGLCCIHLEDKKQNREFVLKGEYGYEMDFKMALKSTI